MIKALVVDDEKRVRRGFIALPDWSAYGISIVGEAKDGASALTLLGELEVDMMFVDIGMPGMSGFELIDQARSRYPKTRAVILTCYHEFDYVQEALRLGAIDYIVKTLLNKSNVDETLQRIVKRFEWERRQTTGTAQRPFESAMVLAPKGRAARDETPPASLAAESKPRRLEGGLWIWTAEAEQAEAWLRELPAHVAGRWQAALVTAGEHDRVSAREAERTIAERLPVHLFYRGGEAADRAVALSELKADAGPAPAELEAAFAEWSECRWLLYGEDWRKFAARVEQWQVDPARLQEWLRSLAVEGASYLGWRGGAGDEEGLADVLGDPETLNDWKQWKSWLSAAALLTQQRLAELSLSREVFGSLIRAVLYMKSNAGRDLNQDEVARRIGMSRSYFSQCFKKFASGEAFGDALRKLRLTAAKELLVGTDLPIRDIAGRVGFEDDKYFSRLFRDRTGLLPSEYRSAGQELHEGGRP
ncbi:response regulator transcription factor [Cohnella hashimotonis]|uniref:Response regulator n=1 Tax=Cohnella hashimotonis TaxID=2826895 RepID=A0ABT6TN94_9BACL|nr:helix-turn-helix domain-containing protein [Cohnella hashimotonis]MDI4648322.1 response regulator [Cohnella hashimotonis]